MVDLGHVAAPSLATLRARSAAAAAVRRDPFRQGLNEAGYVEGRNVAIEYRWAEGQYERVMGG
jgi:putative ABC transport system substrate-binding protein